MAIKPVVLSELKKMYFKLTFEKNCGCKKLFVGCRLGQKLRFHTNDYILREQIHIYKNFGLEEPQMAKKNNTIFTEF